MQTATYYRVDARLPCVPSVSEGEFSTSASVDSPRFIFSIIDSSWLRSESSWVDFPADGH